MGTKNEYDVDYYLTKQTGSCELVAGKYSQLWGRPVKANKP